MPRQSRLQYALLALAAAPLAAQAAPVYTVATVGGFGNLTSQANAVNNAGTVVGYVFTPGHHSNAFSSSGNYSNATSLHQGDPDTGNSMARGVNASGAVVGESSVGNATQATVFSNGAVQTLGTLGGANSFGYGINASGQVVGVSDVGGGSRHGFVTGPNGTLVDIGPVNGGSSSSATAINDLGAVTGYADVDAVGSYRAYIYTNGAMQFLNTLGGSFAEGNAINNAGMVAGYSGTAGDTESHAFLYSNGVVVDIGDLGGNDSYATGINEAGNVVGASNLITAGGYHAFLYSGGVLKDLNDLIDPISGMTLRYAYDINDKGQITAAGCYASGQCASVLLSLTETDTGGDPNKVPEPEALSAGIAGLLLARMLRRRRAAS